METRLDRLFTLLDTGSTPIIRKSAAAQLGEIQKLHPHKLRYLLNKILNLMRSKNWDTRVAAGDAIDAIAKNVPANIAKKVKDETGIKAEPMDTSRSPESPLERFVISAVINDSTSLFSADEEQFELATPVGLDDRELIARQKLLLNKKLGLEGPAGEDIELFNEEDLRMPQQPEKESKATSKLAKEIIEKQLNTEGMSVREISVAKRKARMELKRQSSNGTNVSAPADKKVKTANVAVDQPGQPDKILLDTVAEGYEEEDDDGWPFLDICEVLCNELFSKVWEIRHGAATLLRQIVKQCGYSAGVVNPDSAAEENQLWLEQLSVRLICILALDRFADYISDEVVAPVRETCAQALGTVCRYLTPTCVQSIVHKLCEIINHQVWEVRYGSVLGLKYIIAVRQDLVNDMGSVWPLILTSINDTVDDVRAVTATCLLPVVDKLPAIMPYQVDSLVKYLWDAMLDLDDLTSSTHSMMTLLSALLTVDRLQQFKGSVLVDLVPRVWPFLSHNISSVRKSSLNMLNTVFTECGDLSWLTPILLEMLRHLYQRCLIEPVGVIAELAEKVWGSLVTRVAPELLQQYALTWLSTWICLLVVPAQLPIDHNLIITAAHRKAQTERKVEVAAPETASIQQYHLSGPIQDKPEVRTEKVMFTRLVCSRCIGQFLACIPVHLPHNSNIFMDINRLLEFYLRSHIGTQRMCASLIISHWVRCAQEKNSWPSSEYLTSILLQCAEESLYYDEVAMLFTRLQTECKDFLACLKQQKAPLENHYPPGTLFTIERACELTTVHFSEVKPSLRKQVQEKFTSHAASLMLTVEQLQIEHGALNMRVQMSIAAALVSLKVLPPKLNPVIRPLMETIKKENYYFFQSMASTKLCTVLTLCIDRQPCPNGKVFKNLCTALCAIKSHTPIADQVCFESEDNTRLCCSVESGVISLFTEAKMTETNTQSKRGPKPKKGNSANSTREPEQSTENSARNSSLEDIQYEGAKNAIYTIVSILSENLLTTIPTCTEHFLKPLLQAKDDDVTPQTLVNVLQVLQVVFDVLPSSLREDVLNNFDCLLMCIKSEFSAVRHMAGKAVSACTLAMTGEFMNHILEEVLPLLGASHQTNWRQGAIESIYHIVDTLSVQCIPYLVLMVVPVLGRMTDQDLSVQMMASRCFASLIKLMPLEGGVPDPPEMKKHLLEKKLQEREFLDQLLNGTILHNYGIPIPIKADLRKYQQDGVNWLAFLNKYKLHGVLSDDMGLGKTLQSICIMAGDHHTRQQKYQETDDVESVPLPSLVVCPSTLCGHWVYEVEKFVAKEHLHALNYSVLPNERIRLREQIEKYSLVVASYEIVRNDIEYLKTLHWNYCVLDEGHIIKNAKSKTTQAVKKLNCNHRLILTGTPVQNNVLELWSLFDFLMPGYLGTERQFSARYSRPILQSRDARSSSKEQEAGALAVESLHKQVLPFLLRRLKSDVLQDLPPKIIQDYYCELSPLQAQLYREFSQSSAGHVVEKSLSTMKEDTQEQVGVRGHIFQALQYLKKVCNHPALVITNSKHPHHEQMMLDCKAKGKSIMDLEYSSKLSSLKQLLLDCGIGVTHSQTSDAVTGVVNQHRALIFCQLKMMIDIIESELLKKCLPSVTFMRLDGSTPANSRHHVVNKFNDDPSIDLLLLTTTVGGLGLNLTGADTVIFVEHDWNPMKDLQAMDRAHRIGQTKVVNVYRLITRNTLEEKIMGLQKFKLNIANTIVNNENASLTTMGTDQLLDLFTLEHQVEKDASAGSSPSKGVKAMLQNMTEVWEESEYDNEYDVTNFLASLAKK